MRRHTPDVTGGEHSIAMVPSSISRLHSSPYIRCWMRCSFLIGTARSGKRETVNVSGWRYRRIVLPGESRDLDHPTGVPASECDQLTTIHRPRLRADREKRCEHPLSQPTRTTRVTRGRTREKAQKRMISVLASSALGYGQFQKIGSGQGGVIFIRWDQSMMGSRVSV